MIIAKFWKNKKVPNHQPAIILGKRVAKEFPTSINFGQSRRNWVLTDIEERPTENDGFNMFQRHKEGTKIKWACSSTG